MSREDMMAVDRIQCPNCRMVSFNPEDIRNRYCGNCHQFIDDMVSEEDKKAGGES